MSCHQDQPGYSEDRGGQYSASSIAVFIGKSSQILFPTVVTPQVLKTQYQTLKHECPTFICFTLVFKLKISYHYKGYKISKLGRLKKKDPYVSFWYYWTQLSTK